MSSFFPSSWPTDRAALGEFAGLLHGLNECGWPDVPAHVQVLADWLEEQRLDREAILLRDVPSLLSHAYGADPPMHEHVLACQAMSDARYAVYLRWAALCLFIGAERKGWAARPYPLVSGDQFKITINIP